MIVINFNYNNYSFTMSKTSEIQWTDAFTYAKSIVITNDSSLAERTIKALMNHITNLEERLISHETDSYYDSCEIKKLRYSTKHLQKILESYRSSATALKIYNTKLNKTKNNNNNRIRSLEDKNHSLRQQITKLKQSIINNKNEYNLLAKNYDTLIVQNKQYNTEIAKMSILIEEYNQIYATTYYRSRLPSAREQISVNPFAPPSANRSARAQTSVNPFASPSDNRSASAPRTRDSFGRLIANRSTREQTSVNPFASPSDNRSASAPRTRDSFGRLRTNTSTRAQTSVNPLYDISVNPFG